MIRIDNPTNQNVTLSSGHEIPAGGHLVVSPQTLLGIESDAYGARLLAARRIVVSQPDPKPEPLTRATIAAATRGELLDILEAHGVERGDVSGRNVEDSEEKGEGLRSLAARAVFADL